MNDELKRVCFIIKDEQHEELVKRKVNVSGLIRDLLDDYLSESKITLSVSPELHLLYDKVIINSGGNDIDFEPFLKEALLKYLEHRIAELTSLKNTVRAKERS